MLNTFTNMVTYCKRCSSVLYWNAVSHPTLLQLGNNDLVTCLETGCELLKTTVPEVCCEAGEVDLLRLALIQSGVPEEDANLAVTILSVGHEAVAA
jgi:hypothetical protein